MPGEAEGGALGAFLLPRPAVRRDETEPPFDVGGPRRPHEPELGVRAEQQRVREGVAIDRAAARVAIQQRHGLVDERDPALEIALHHEVPEPAEDDPAEMSVRVARLRQPLLAERDRLRNPAVVVADDRPQAERVRPRRAGRPCGDRRREDAVGLEILRQVDEQALRGELGESQPGLGVVVRRQPARVLVEARGGERRAAQPGVPGGVGERRGDGRVGAVDRLGEVPGAGVRGRRRGGQGLVRRPQLGRARERRDALGEQRVAEPDGVAVDRHEVVLDRRAKVVREPRRRRLERRQRRLRRRGREEHRPARSGRQQREAARDQRAQAVGHGQRVVRVGRDPAPDERAAHLERVERVPARRLLDADEDEARERPAQAELEQPMQRREVQRPDEHALQPVGRDRADDLVGRLRLGPRPHRQQERDRPIRQPPDRVGEDRRRALVEELDVVDRDDDRAIRFDELAEQPRDRDRQRPLIGRRAARRGAQERDRERVALRRGKPGEDVVADAAEEIDEPAERQSLLGLRRPRREDEPAALGGVVGGGLPDGRLPDPGLALEDERRQPVPGPREERLECGELGAPPHDLVGHGTERTPATRIRSSSRSMERAPRWFHGDMTVPLPPDGAPHHRRWTWITASGTRIQTEPAPATMSAGPVAGSKWSSSPTSTDITPSKADVTGSMWASLRGPRASAQRSPC